MRQYLRITYQKTVPHELEATARVKVEFIIDTYCYACNQLIMSGDEAYIVEEDESTYWYHSKHFIEAPGMVVEN